MNDIGLQPELQDKINHACKVFEEVLQNYRRPVLLCSFGKDSMVMLWMIREWFTKEIPIVLFKHPFFPRKYTYADRMISEWDLNVHQNIPPIGSSLSCKDGKTEVIHHYSMGAGSLVVPIGKQDIEGREGWLCGIKDILSGPYGSYNWPWDVAFCGHRSTDVDPLLGSIALRCDVHQNPDSSHLAFPLRHFTDDDIWTLHKAWGIPFDKLRYESQENPVTHTEGTFNSDYFPYCNKCFDPFQPEFVVCPKTGLQITNIHSKLLKTEVKLDYMKG